MTMLECSLFVSFFPLLIELYTYLMERIHFSLSHVTACELIGIFMIISNMHLQNRLRYAVDAF